MGTVRARLVPPGGRPRTMVASVERMSLPIDPFAALNVTPGSLEGLQLSASTGPSVVPVRLVTRTGEAAEWFDVWFEPHVIASLGVQRGSALRVRIEAIALGFSEAPAWKVAEASHSP